MLADCCLGRSDLLSRPCLPIGQLRGNEPEFPSNDQQSKMAGAMRLWRLA